MKEGNAWSRKLTMIREIEKELGLSENEDLNFPGLLQAGEKTVTRLLELMKTVEDRPDFVPPAPSTYWMKNKRINCEYAKWPSMNHMLYELERHLHLDHSKIGCGFDVSLSGLLGLSRETMTNLLGSFENWDKPEDDNMWSIWG